MLTLLFFLCIGPAIPAVYGQSLSPGIYLKLKEASKLTEAGNAKEAISKLQLLEEALQKREYELAMVRQYLVYAHMAAEEPKIARDIAVKALKSEQLPAEAAHALTWLVVQFAYQLEDYRSCIHYVKQMISAENSPPAKAWFLAGFSYYRLKQPRKAEQHLEHAIAQVKKIPDNWHQVLLAVYLDNKRYKKAESVLLSLMKLEPDNKTWWNYLVSVYLDQDKEDKALAALVLAYYQGQLEADDLMRIVQLYNYNGIPEKAARLLAGWLKEGRLKATHKICKLQFELWHLACEHGPALQALEKAASLADSGEDYLLLGRLYIERNEWHKAREALQRALHNGIDEEAKAYYLLGIVAFNCNDHNTARLAFEKAVKNPELGKVVAYWSDRLYNRSIKRKSLGPSFSPSNNTYIY
jgi:tetratricopeptide (TPR) repeat protein